MVRRTARYCSRAVETERIGFFFLFFIITAHILYYLLRQRIGEGIVLFDVVVVVVVVFFFPTADRSGRAGRRSRSTNEPPKTLNIQYITPYILCIIIRAHECIILCIHPV